MCPIFLGIDVGRYPFSMRLNLLSGLTTWMENMSEELCLESSASMTGSFLEPSKRLGIISYVIKGRDCVAKWSSLSYLGSYL